MPLQVEWGLQTMAREKLSQVINGASDNLGCSANRDMASLNTPSDHIHKSATELRRNFVL